MDQIEREIDLKDVREAATDLKKDFDESKRVGSSMNRIPWRTTRGRKPRDGRTGKKKLSKKRRHSETA